ncbi:MAG: DEAD/DEAH box helicase, partial [Candidatus Woesearchaeota archaeon]
GVFWYRTYKSEEFIYEHESKKEKVHIFSNYFIKTNQELLFRMTDFTKLGLKQNVLYALSTLKFTKPTEVQEKIIPLMLKGKNVVFTSRTGSGKTLAFLLGFVGKIKPKMGLQMIVMVPTRELCIQVGKEMSALCDLIDIKVGMLYGGRTMSGDQKTVSKKVQIMVGTPGRLLQHVNAKNIAVGEVHYIVYDESDQIFDNGFYDECAYLKTRVSKNAQIILASATISNRVDEFIKKEIKEYEFEEVGEQIPKNIVQEKVLCEIKDKNEVLVRFLASKTFKRAIVFCNQKTRCDYVAELFGRKARSLHSDFKQDERNNILNMFKQGRISVLVTTDVAARGLHIPEVDIVINYDVSRQPEFHVHRMGRTGRNDSSGYALTMVCPEDVKRFQHIELGYELDVTEITV